MPSPQGSPPDPIAQEEIHSYTIVYEQTCEISLSKFDNFLNFTIEFFDNIFENLLSSIAYVCNTSYFPNRALNMKIFVKVFLMYVK